MSRSYKKYPSGKCEKSCKKGQRFASKTIRKYNDVIPNGKAYEGDKYDDTCLTSLIVTGGSDNSWAAYSNF